MKQRLLSSAALGRFATVAALGTAMTALSATAAFAAPVRLWVDPGHGGKDPGAVTGGLTEAGVNLEVSNIVVESAKRQGWTVAMTRSDDRYIGVNERPAAANAWGANALVSVHANSTGNKALGSMTIYRSPGGKSLGDNIMKELDPLTPYKDIGNRADVRNLGVLRGAKMPAVIVEMLGMSSAEENAALKDPARKRAMAEAIVKGVAAQQGVTYTPPVAPKKATPKAAPKPAPAPAPKPAPAPAPAPKAAPKAEPKVAPKPVEPKAEPTVTPEPKAAPKADPKPKAEPKAGARNLFAPLSTLLGLFFR